MDGMSQRANKQTDATKPSKPNHKQWEINTAKSLLKSHKYKTPIHACNTETPSAIKQLTGSTGAPEQSPPPNFLLDTYSVPNSMRSIKKRFLGGKR